MKSQPIDLKQLARIRDGSSHSVFGPSGSSMWLNCLGSLIPNLLADDVAGIDAAYGTVAHGVIETWGKTGKRPDYLVGTNEFVEAGEWGFLIDIDEVMLNYCQMCIDWVELLPGLKFWECRVDFSRLTPIPRQSGTADFICIHEDKLIICDWKMGRAHQIFAEKNSQGMLYALGAIFEFHKLFGGEYEFSEVEIRIAQPRLDHFDTWNTTVTELLAWGEWAKERMHEAWTPNAPRTPGVKQCEFCRVKADCAAWAKFNVEMTEGIFGDTTVTPEQMQDFKERVDDLDFAIDMADTAVLETSQIVALVGYRKVAEKWWNSLDLELAKRAKAGEDLALHGRKFVEGRSFRVFNDKDVALKRMIQLGVPREKVVTEKIASPNQCEKLLLKSGRKGKEIPSLLAGLISRPPGKPTLVPLSDKRPAIVDISEAVFGDTTNPETEEEEI